MRKCFVNLISLAVIVSLILGAVSIAFAQQVKGPSPVMYNTLKDYEKATGKKITSFSEAPMLAELVKQGKLPPVEKRLPGEDTVVIKPAEEIGQYGGTARAVHINPSDLEDAGVEGFKGSEPMLRVAPDGKTILPNIAKSWKFTEGGKVLTLYLRKGIKWSDGEPFTADDIMFWWEDVILNDELTPVKPKEWSPGGKLMEVKKINNYTVQLRFAVPYYVATLYLAHYLGGPSTFYFPKHYMKQFHPKYTPMEKLKAMCKEGGYDKWYQLFWAKSPGWTPSVPQDVGIPTIEAYVLKNKKPGVTVLERNPYYWKVDTEGNQLPYIDQVQATLVSDPEAVNMKAITGEVDFAALHLSLQNYPLYMENAQKGGYRVQLRPTSRVSEVGFTLNQTHPDPVKCKIFQDVRFRIALSVALNREEINKTIFFGKGVPMQVTFSPLSAFYEEEWAKAYTEYDPKRANQLLDEMGLDKRDSQGYRLMPDGKRLTITIEYWPYSCFTPVAELAKEYWENIGIQIILKTEERSFWGTRMLASLHDMTVWEIVNSDLLFPSWHGWAVPYIGDLAACPWGNKWHDWYFSSGKQGWEPPEKVKRLFKLFETYLTAPSDKERIKAAKELGRAQAENLWVIGTVGFVPHPVVVSNKLRNVPENGLWAWDWLFETISHPEQYYLKK